MNAPIAREALESFQLPTIFALPEDQQIATLCSSLYPGARPESALMVLNYCRAANLDPMQKPVHIVPMDVKTGRVDGNGKDIYEKRDVVMPGIGLYRIQATRTGSYAGQDEPEFGECVPLSYSKKETTWVDSGRGRQKREDWVNAELNFPRWCKVTVYRIVQGVRYAFTAKELWLENYGTQSRWSEAPNAMWEKRTFAQLAKCAEAQALRKAFPDAVSSAPTADELEGKRYDFELEEGGTATDVKAAPAEPPRKPAPAAEPAAAAPTPAAPTPAAEPAQAAQTGPTPAPQPTTQAPAQTSPPAGVFMATGGEKQNVVVRCRNAKRGQAEVLHTVLGEGHGIHPETLEGMTKEQFKLIRTALS